jgi:hypothetical protein
MANAEFRAAPPEFLGAACVKETERAHQDGVARDVTTDPMAEVRAELIFRSLLLRRMLDLAGSDFAGPDDDELLVEATTHSAQPPTITSGGPTGLFATRSGRSARRLGAGGRDSND